MSSDSEFTGDKFPGSKDRVPEIVVRSAEIWQLYSQVRLGMFATIGAALALAALLWQVVPRVWIVVWVVVLLAIQIPRHLLLRRFHRVAPHGAEASVWGNWFLLGSGATSLVFGMSAVVIFPSDSLFHQAVLACFLGGLAASTAVAHAPLTACYVSSVLLTLLPLLGRFLHQGGELGMVLAAIGFAFAAALLVTASSLHRMLVASIQMRFQRDEMARNVHQAHEMLETLVADRTSELARKNAELLKEIIERKKAEEALRLEKARFQVLSEHLPLGLVSISDEGAFHYVNRKFGELFGYDLADVPDGRHWFRIAYPDPEYRHHVISCWVHDLDKTKPGEQRPREFNVTCKNGSRKTVLFRPVQLTSGEHLMTCEDITERKRVERAVEEHVTMLEAILEKAADGICVCHTIDEFPYVLFSQWNPRMLEITGYTMEEINEAGWFQSVHPDPDIQMRAIERMARMRAGGDLRAEEWTITSKEGTQKQLSISTSIIKEGDRQIHVLAIMQDIAERKKDEAALRESEQRFRSTFEQAAVGICHVSPDGRFLRVNQKLCDILGYTADHLLSLTFQEITHPDDLDTDLDFVARVLADEIKTYSMEKRYVRRDGSLLWANLTVSLTREPSGAPKYFISVVEDISYRKSAEQALRDSEERYRRLVEESFDGIFVQRGPTIVFANSRLCEMLGYSETELVGQDHWKVYHTDYQELTRSRAQARMRGESVPSKYEVRLQRKDGSPFDGEINAKVVTVEGQPGVQVWIKDVTDRKQAELSLKESEERYRELFDNSADLIYTHDLEGNYTSVNKAVERILGYTPQEFLNLNFRDIVDPDYLALTEENFRSKVNGHADRTGPYQVLVRTKDGQARWLEVNSRIIIHEGSRIGVHGTLRDISDRKLVEDQLKQEREFTDAILRSVPGLLYLFDEEGRMVRWNKQLEELPGYSAEEVARMRLSDWFGGREPDTSLTAQRFQDVLTKGRAAGEANLITKDGTAIPFYFTGVKLTIAGKPYMTGIGIDITERKRAEAQIKLNESRLESLYNISQYNAQTIQDLLDFTLNEAVKLTESEVGYIYFYDEEKKLFELNTWSKKVMKECEVAEPQTQYELDKTGIWGEAVRQRKPIVVNDFQAPNPLRKGYPKGHVKLHNFMTIPLFWGETIVAVVGVANKGSDYDESDVRQLALLMDSVWKIAEARRSELSQRRLATALEYAAEGVIITDIDGTIEYVNPSLERMTGYTREEFVGKNPRVLKSGTQDTAFYEELWRKIKGGDTWTGRFVNKRKDGTLYTEDATISPVRDASGAITNFVGTKRDITDQLALSKQLLHAQKMEAIGTLAGGMAHDFNNVLQAILGYSDLLLMKKGPRDLDRKRLEVIQRAARDGADLVSRILTFSRKAESRTRPIDLNAEIRKAQELLRRTVPRMIEIKLMLAEDLQIIDADPAQMEQVLLNLAVNAQHAMPDGGQLLIETSNVSLSDEYFRTHLGAKPGHYVLLTVSDTGVGVEPEVLDRMFEPFFTTKTNEEGTGLGLAMVHGIVSQHGGYIRCYSEPGRGTSFKIYLPVSRTESLSSLAETREMPAFGTETILIVDDDDRIRDISQQMIEMGGYKVLTAPSGEEALKIYHLRKNEISLIILDLIMPGMGGKRCLRELLRIDPDVRVLVASGFSSNDLTFDEKEAGARGFVRKPYDAKDILGAIRNVLDKGHL